MKVLYIVSGVGPPAGWGSEFIQQLIFKLSKKGIKATIITPIYSITPGNWKSWMQNMESEYGVKFEVVRIPKIFSSHISQLMVTPIFTTVKIFSVLTRTKFDLIHEFSSISVILIRSALIKILFNVPTLFSIVVYNNSVLSSKFWIKVFRSYIKVSTPNELSASIDFSKFDPIPKDIAKKKLDLPVNKRLVSYFGTLTEEKGIREIWKAAKEMETSKDIIFVIYCIWRGSTEHNLYKNKLTKLRNVILSEEYVDIKTLLSASDVALFPQRTGFGTTVPPLSLLEASAVGTPFIASDIEINKQVFDLGFGKKIKPKSYKSLILEINNALSDKKNEIKNIKPLKDKFDHAANVNKIVSMYNQILK